MSDKRDEILKIGEDLLRRNGYNAFSYNDISRPLGIKNAAIHYYFPKKSDLGISIIHRNLKAVDDLDSKYASSSALTRLKAFMNVYAESYKNNKVCLVGALATELYSLEEDVQQELKIMVKDTLAALTNILVDGRKNGEFVFSEPPRTKALLIITNMLAALQLSRITGEDDFSIIEKAILKNLKG